MSLPESQTSRQQHEGATDFVCRMMIWVTPWDGSGLIVTTRLFFWAPLVVTDSNEVPRTLLLSMACPPTLLR
jgi:hypothetical protein